MNSSLGTQNSYLSPNTKLLQSFLDASSSSTKNGANSLIQMSRDGNSIICTRHNSALAQFIARVFTKLLPMDFYDKFCISNQERQQQAVEKFHDIMVSKNLFGADEPIVAKSMNLNNLGDILKQLGISPQDTGANVLRKMFSISNIDKNKIASGDFKKDLKNFAGINIDEFPDGDKYYMKSTYDLLKTRVQNGMAAYGFSNDEIGYVFASMIEEMKPVLSKYNDFHRFEVMLSMDLSQFINQHSENLGDDYSYGTEDIKRIADEALKIMTHFAQFSDFVRGTGPSEEIPPGFAKTALLPVLNVAASFVRDSAVAANMAAGGGTALAALEQFSSQKSNAENPQLARCASFEPILAVLKTNGLMLGANNSFNKDENGGKISEANIQAAWDIAATKFIQDLATQQT